MRQVFIIILFFSIVASGQTKLKYDLDSVIITTNRVPVSFIEVGRSINIITQKEIEKLPVTNIQDLLEYNSGIDVRQRGPESVQADISIRGGSFKQTLILVDGIKLTDSQTGHHNMNLPISLSQIERIEILKGQGSRIHGANAFSGIINIITKKRAINNVNLSLSGGENGYYNYGINSSLKLGNTNHFISMSKNKSDGYRDNTQFDNYNFSINNSLNFSDFVIKTIYGYTNKDFGANSFYTTRFPNQAEKTKTQLAAISAEIAISDFNISPKIYWRNNEDEFVLDKNNHAFYKNNHETNVFGGELQGSTNILGGTTSFGFEYTRDEIVSNNLGEHKREQKGFFVEQNLNLANKLNISFGGFASHYSDFDWKFLPGVDVAFNPIKNLKIFANYGKAFRIPTYTELYYSSPDLKGNSDLNSEESTNYELGFNYDWKFINVHSSFFRKEGRNLIDYQINLGDNLWYANNINKVNTNGLEIGLIFSLQKVSNIFLKQINIDYTFLDSDKLDVGNDSKYVLEHLKHDLTIKVFHNLLLGISQSWAVNYEDRISLDDHLTIDTKFVRNFSKFDVFLKISNILNKSYEEFPGIPLPGRWIIGGLKINIL